MSPPYDLIIAALGGYALAIMVGYFLGSIPFGLLLTRMAGLGDIRTIGSGNIGATNVLRTGNKKVAFFTLLLDGGKGAVAVLLAQHFMPGTEQAVAMAAVVGHIFPVWLKFKGGKGVATAFGVTLALAWPVGLVAMALWLSIMALSRISSLGGIVAIGLLPLLAFFFGELDLIIPLGLIATLVVAKHHDNIRRLLNGTENRFGKKNCAPDATSETTPV